VLYVGEYDVMLGKDLQGYEIWLGKFTAGSNEEPIHTHTNTHTKRENALKHCLETTSEPQSDLYDQEHTQTWTANICCPPNAP